MFFFVFLQFGVRAIKIVSTYSSRHSRVEFSVRKAFVGEVEYYSLDNDCRHSLFIVIDKQMRIGY